MSNEYMEAAAELRKKQEAEAEDSESVKVIMVMPEEAKDDDEESDTSIAVQARPDEDFDGKQDPDDVVRSQFILKQSKHLKLWRKRWTVLTKDRLCTYKEDDMSLDPTMNIHMEALNKVEPSDEHTGHEYSFDVTAITDEDGSTEVYSFRCESSGDRNRWMEKILETRTEWENRRNEGAPQTCNCCVVQ